jgi:hypothetical protein
LTPNALDALWTQKGIHGTNRATPAFNELTSPQMADQRPPSLKAHSEARFDDVHVAVVARDHAVPRDAR